MRDGETGRAGRSFTVAMVGLGYFGQYQFNAWQRLENASLVALADQSVKAREKASAKPDLAVFSELDAMLANVTPDILDVATPPATHADILRKALGRVETVICQKPFCTSLSEAEEMVALAHASGTRLIIHENFRFMPWYRVIGEQIANGAVGEVRQAHFRFRPGDGGGKDAYLARQPYFREMKRFFVHETGIHWIDVFRYLFGEPKSVFADLWKVNPAIAGEDAGLLVFDFERGLRAVLDGNRTLDHAADNTRLTMGEFLVEGSKGTIALDGFGVIRLRLAGEKVWQTIPYEFDDNDFGGDCVFLFQKHVVDHLAGMGPLETEAGFWLANMRLEDACYRSAREERRVAVGSSQTQGRK